MWQPFWLVQRWLEATSGLFRRNSAIQLRSGSNRLMSTSKGQFEVERKFHLEKEDLKRVSAIGVFKEQKQFTDVYFDTKDYFLTKRDIWFRERSGQFECKVPIDMEQKGMDGYKELTSEKEISSFLMTFFPAMKSFDTTQAFGLNLKSIGVHPFASLTTRRTSLKKDEFEIDLDVVNSSEEASYEYMLGEVELIVDRQEDMEAASKKIIAFCEENQLDISKPVRGKVLEFLYRHRPLHYQALVDSGLIQRKSTTS